MRKPLHTLTTLWFGALLLSAVPFGITYAQATPDARTSQTAAQPVTKASWLSVTVVNVKPEMLGDFESFMKSTTNPALRKGGLKWRDVWRQTAAAGNPNEFTIVTPVESMADFDGQSALERALGSAGYSAWQNKASSYVSSVHRYIMRTRPDMSYEPKMEGPPKLALVTTMRVSPDRRMEFENWSKNEYLPVIKRSKVTGYWVSEIIFGGTTDEYVVVSLRDKFAEIDNGPLVVQVLGPQGARELNQKLPPGAVVQVQQSFIRFVPELSFR